VWFGFPLQLLSAEPYRTFDGVAEQERANPLSDQLGFNPEVNEQDQLALRN